MVWGNTKRVVEKNNKKKLELGNESGTTWENNGVIVERIFIHILMLNKVFFFGSVLVGRAHVIRMSYILFYFYPFIYGDW